MEIIIPNYIKNIISALEKEGFEAFCVGGCVRDSIMKKTPNDWDLTTSATPEEMLKVFFGYNVIETGLKHGTITVIAEKNPVEITTYRIDGSYQDSRHPDRVEFTANLTEDLKRRDFTINAIAYNPKTGLVDPFSGQKDIENKVIRCVGDPLARFTEDALRIMRALRFSAVLGFSIDSSTKAAAIELRSNLRAVSAERISIELNKLICGINAENILREYHEIVFAILPELQPMYNCKQETKYHIYDVWEHTLHAVGAGKPELNIRLALLFHDSGKPKAKLFDEKGVAHFYKHACYSEEICKSALRRLRYPNKTIDTVSSLVFHHDNRLPLKDSRIKKLLNKLGEERFFEMIEVMYGDSAAHSPDIHEGNLPLIQEFSSRAKYIIDNNICYSLKTLAVDGEDLKALGYSSGSDIGETLNQLLEMVISGGIQNNREKLLKTGAKILRNKSKADGFKN